jgi:ADP-heptose:LPS heptosyltransferase
MIKSLVKNIYLSLRGFLLRILVKRGKCESLDPGKVDSILVIRLDRIGDLVQSTPAIKAIKKIFPQAKITGLFSRSAVDLAKLIPEIDEIIVYRGFFSAFKTLKNRKFFLTIDLLMDYTLKTALLSHFSGADFTSGFDIKSRGQLFNASLKPAIEPKSMNKHILDLARFLAKLSGKSEKDFPDTDPILVLTPELREFAGDFLKIKGVNYGEPIFGIALGAKFPSQCWNEAKFAELADRIVDKYQARIVIIGSGQEETKVSRVVSLMKNQPIIALGLPLDKLAGLISTFKLLVANNSGPLHMAAALNVATVSTMGPTVPHFWWPQGKNHIVIRRELACSPCDRAVCLRHECLESISAEEMEKAIELLMAKI